MKLKELKEIVNSYPTEYDDLEILVQKDAEGSGYEIMAGISDDGILTNDYQDNIYSLDWTAEDAGMSEEEWKHFKEDNQRCLVIYPR